MSEPDDPEIDFGIFGGGGNGQGDDSDRSEDEGGGLLGFLVDLDVALGDFAGEIEELGDIVYDDSLLHFADLSKLGARLAREDGRPRVKFLIRDLRENYLLRAPALAAVGLTGKPVVYKTRMASRRNSVRRQLQDLGERFRAWQRYFNVATSIISSLLEGLSEIPGMKALIETLKELLEFLAFNAEEIAEQH